jgi:polyisoprenyl-phosphate glycosyltransferase
MDDASELSIVIPLFNEEANIGDLFAGLNSMRGLLPERTEVILVDDGSSDKTLLELEARPLHYAKIVLSLSRNFGHQSAVLAGLEASRGQYVVTMDGDLQHPPEMIPEMLGHHRKGIDVVVMQRIDDDVVSPFKKTTARAFYALINALSDTKIAFNASDFRSLSRQALRELLALPERRKFLRGMVPWIGFSSVTLAYSVRPRRHGRSKYSLAKMIRLALSGITSFTAFPLYLAGLFSLILFICAVGYAGYVVYIKYFAGTAVSGWASVLFVLLLIGGFLSLFLGLLGVYVAAIYDEVKQRPNYIVRSGKKP